MNNTDEMISVASLLSLLAQKKWIAIATFSLGLLPFVLLAFLSTPVYRAEVLLFPVSSSSGSSALKDISNQLGGLGSLMSLDFLGEDATNTNIAVLRSRGLAEATIEQENLKQTLFEEYWDPQDQVWIGKYKSKAPTIREAYEVFTEDVVSIIEDRKRGTVVVRIELNDRFLAADWANLFVDRANEHLRAMAIEDASSILKFLEDSLAKTSSTELRQSMFRLTEVQLEKMAFANARPEYAFKIIDRAVVMDDDMFVWPNPIMLILLGCLLGAMGTVIFLIARYR